MFQPTMPWPAPKHGTKRKSLPTPDTVFNPPPEKHFITEEEMSSEMQMLQLEEQSRILPGYDYRPPGLPFTFNAHGQFSGFGEPSQNTTSMGVSASPYISGGNVAHLPGSQTGFLNPVSSSGMVQNNPVGLPTPFAQQNTPYTTTRMGPSKTGLCSNSMDGHNSKNWMGFSRPDFSSNVPLSTKENEDSEMDSESRLPRLTVSEEVLKINPQPVLPPSLMAYISPRDMALVPYVPALKFQPNEDEYVKKDEMDMVD